MADQDTTQEPSVSAASDPATEDERASAQQPGDDGASRKAADDSFDLKGIVRQLTAPMIESLDTRLRDQIEAHVDELLTEKLDAALADRLSTVDRAIADLSRSIDALERRLGAHEKDVASS
ncbi:MAG TPA: hypothetical protein VMQ40_02700 [Acidimicrobiales bacterium]|jgi:hypothetical protein|nr:hypothetical protein [Acidimicrobiales bacterium]